MDIEKLSLEETMNLLEKTAQELENGDCTLDKSIEMYENGVKLASHARTLLDGYTQKLTVLKKENGIIKEAIMEGKADD